MTKYEILSPSTPSFSKAGLKKHAGQVGAVATGATILALGFGLYQVIIKPGLQRVPIVGSLAGAGSPGGAAMDAFGTLMGGS